MAGDSNRTRNIKWMGVSQKRSSRGTSRNIPTREKDGKTAKKTNVASQKAGRGPENKTGHQQAVERRSGHKGGVQEGCQQMGASSEEGSKDDGGLETKP